MLSSSRSAQIELPGFSRQIVAEFPVPVLLREVKPRFFVDKPRRSEVRLRPEHQPAVALCPRERDALGDEALAQPEPPRPRLDKEEPQFRRLFGLLLKENRTYGHAVPLGDPAVLALRVEVLHEAGDDPRHQG